MSIEVRSITKRFGPFTALHGVDLVVPSGKLVALLGPSGSGKTTLLRMIAGLEPPDSGSIMFEGADATRRSAKDRNVGFVFQHYALFRHMTVFENVAFGLRVRPRAQRPSRIAITERVRELLGLVELDWAAGRYPAQLSGGQRQRVALARALATQPQVLLLDEPFGALDARVRQDLRRWLRRLHDDLHITSLFVTHDQEEALEVADRVVIMNRGKIEQEGTPEQVYDHPSNSFVYKFLGTVNLFHGRVHDGLTAVGYARPHDLDVTRQPAGGESKAAAVAHIRAAGPSVRIELTCVGEPMEAELSRTRFEQLALKVGNPVYVTPRTLTVFAEDYAI